jgi:pyocin large subunit-like protein
LGDSNISQHFIFYETAVTYSASGFTRDGFSVIFFLIQKPVGNGIHGHVDKTGKIIRYDAASNDFVTGHSEKGVHTMMKPKDGLEYYERQKERDLKNGGSA